MKIIDNGIKIQCTGEISDRTEISAGTEQALGYSASGVPFRTGAFKPRRPWRKLSVKEIEALSINEGDIVDYSNTVTVLKLPEVLTDRLTELKLDKVLSKFYFKQHYNRYQTQFNAAKQLMHLYFSSFNQQEKEIIASFFSVNDPNLEVTTKYFEGRQYTGLHIDNWENASIETAHLAQNRACINLGTQTRYLLFINQPLCQLKDRIVEKAGGFHMENTQWHLGQRFFKYYGTYPVVKIAIKPMEAYIAPTENMLHDGSTFESTNPDITFTMRGYFSI